MDSDLTMKNKRKIFILDTSVLLYDKCSIHSFPGNDIVLPLIILDELDRFKDKKGIIGENARYVNRYLDNLRKNGSLHKGIEVDNGQTIRVEIGDHTSLIPAGLDKSDADNKIISSALCLSKNSSSQVTVITKDINFRVKCDSLQIFSEDYYKDRVILDDTQVYSGYIDIEIEDSEVIDDAYEDCMINSSVIENMGYEIRENQFICLKNNSQSFLGMKEGNEIKKILNIENMDLDIIGVKPRNREQLYALNLLMRDDIPLVSLAGIAGSGKTFLTLMAGIHGINTQRYDRIVLTRNMQPVGREIGFLPGGIDEKMEPWIAPIVDNFRQGLKDKDLTYFQAMRSKGKIEIAPLSFMRGRTFSDTFLILDEAQNASIHEIKTVITRIGENSKIVILGDIEQIDTPYIDSLSNGLTIISEKFKKESLAGHVTLKKGERSNLATLASKIL